MRWKISVSRISLNRAYCLPSWHDGTRILVDRLWPRGIRNSEAAIDPWTRTIARSAPCASGSDTILPIDEGSGGARRPNCVRSHAAVR
jgi:hypothetical protein